MTSNNKETKESQSASKADDDAQPRSRSRSWSAPQSHPKPGRTAHTANPSKSSSDSSKTILEILNSKLNKVKNNPVVETMEETFASIASRPPLPKVMKFTITEAALAAATAELAAAVSKHRANFQTMLTSSIAKRTPAQENRLRADNVALMTSATICFQQAGGTRITLERLYKLARQEERAARQSHEKALASTPIKINKLKTMMSTIMNAEGFSIVNCQSSSPSLRANPAPTPRDGSRVNLFTEEFLNASREEDLKDYSLNPTTRQPTKKAFCGEKNSLVTAALLTTTAVSPARVSIYTNKRAALASPAKLGTKQQKGKGNHPASKISPSAERKQEFDRTMEEMECSREEYKTTRKAKIAPLEHLVNKEEQESTAKEAARLTQIKVMGEHYYEIARAKVAQEDTKKQGGHQTQGEDEKEDTDNEGADPGGIYSRQRKEDDKSFNYHKSEASSDDKDKEEFGIGGRGCSPLSMGQYELDNALEEEPFDWLKKIDSRGTYDKKDLLAESTNQTFPCIACNDHKNILDPATWVPEFLRKSSATTWDVFDIDFEQTVHDLEWNGDEGLKNLWGLYYKCPDAHFIRLFKSNCKTSATPGLNEGKMKSTIKATND
jgi:hypothetical protein